VNEPRFPNVIFWWSLAFALISTQALRGQVTTATFFVNVTDSTGAVIPQASVKLVHDGTGATVTKATDGQGEAAFTFLRVGTYTISIESKGFKRQELGGLELGAGQQVRQTFPLELGATSETVRVEASVPLINTVSSEQINLFEAIKVRELPLARRNFSNLLSLGTGVVSTGDSIRMNGVGKNGPCRYHSGTRCEE